jgi:hypothetical protein
MTEYIKGKSQCREETVGVLLTKTELELLKNCIGWTPSADIKIIGTVEQRKLLLKKLNSLDTEKENDTSLVSTRKQKSKGEVASSEISKDDLIHEKIKQKALKNLSEVSE